MSFLPGSTGAPHLWIDDNEEQWIRDTADRVDELEAETAALEAHADVRRIVQERLDDRLASFDIAERIAADVPLTGDGAIHEHAVRALAEVALWAARLDELEDHTIGG